MSNEKNNDNKKNKIIAALWSAPAPAQKLQELEQLFCTALETPVRVFFRADDIARTDREFIQMMELFQQYSMPLCLAVVPGWLSPERWQAMEVFRPECSLWCWHQHGLHHQNHQLEGKKAEFGSERSKTQISTDLTQGKRHLEHILGEIFYPVFTPPWNRCSRDTLESLEDLGFLALSRSKNAKPASEQLPDVQINVDLHTRKETDFAQGWENLVQEFSAAAAQGTMGIMLHHEQMNRHAFNFLAWLLHYLQTYQALHPDQVQLCSFRELITI